jgi:hypothetical protein
MHSQVITMHLSKCIIIEDIYTFTQSVYTIRIYINFKKKIIHVNNTNECKDM